MPELPVAAPDGHADPAVPFQQSNQFADGAFHSDQVCSILHNKPVPHRAFLAQSGGCGSRLLQRPRNTETGEVLAKGGASVATRVGNEEPGLVGPVAAVHPAAAAVASPPRQARPAPNAGAGGPPTVGLLAPIGPPSKKNRRNRAIFTQSKRFVPKS